MSIECMNIIMQAMQNHFEITVREVDHLVGINIIRERTKKTIFLYPVGYINKTLKRFKMLNSKPVITPMAEGFDLSVMQKVDRQIERLLYRKLVGSLICLCMVTRPDLAFALNVVRRYMDEIFYR